MLNIVLLTYDKINKIIAKMASEKALGTSGTTTDMLKNLPQTQNAY